MIWLWSKIKGAAIWVGIVLAAIGAAWLSGRKAGIDHIEAEQNKRRIEAMKDRKAVDDEIQNLGEQSIDTRLSKWMRDGR